MCLYWHPALQKVSGKFSLLLLLERLESSTMCPEDNGAEPHLFQCERAMGAGLSPIKDRTFHKQPLAPKSRFSRGCASVETSRIVPHAGYQLRSGAVVSLHSCTDSIALYQPLVFPNVTTPARNWCGFPCRAQGQVSQVPRGSRSLNRSDRCTGLRTAEEEGLL